MSDKIFRDGFEFRNRFFDNEALIIQDGADKRHIDYINEHKVKAVEIGSYFTKGSYDAITFFKECPDIEVVYILSRELDYEPLYSLTKLRQLSVSNEFSSSAVSTLDLSCFHHLECLNIGWDNNIKGLNKCKALKRLSIIKYKPNTKSLLDLSGLENLVTLTLLQASIASLDGIEGMKSIRKLEMNYIKSKVDLESLTSNTLSNLTFQNCTQLYNHDHLGKLSNLVSFRILSCNSLESIYFIKDITKLKYLNMYHTNVIDGDISPCHQLEYASITARRNFSFKSYYKNRFANPHDGMEDLPFFLRA